MAIPPERKILKLAIPSPLYRVFDYLAPAQASAATLRPGVRVRAPFGRRSVVAVLMAVANQSELPVHKLKAATDVLDDTPLLPDDIMDLLHWAASYYHHPLGEAFAAALPTLLRQGRPAQRTERWRWQLTEAGRRRSPSSLGRRPRQQRLLEAMAEHPRGMTPAQLSALGGDWRPALRRLQQEGLVTALAEPTADMAQEPVASQSAPTLTDEQARALKAIDQDRGFGVWLLEGITGSGKTEVYLRAIERQLTGNRQTLILVPEIGLTPQLVGRLRARFGVPMAVFHSGLTDRERLDAWLMARDGSARLVVGTRSAVFVPLATPGLIVVDEEHDPSLKQQEGWRYSARDLAVWRARRLNVPIILGSATPSLESLHNAAEGRYRHLRLSHRTNANAPPHPRLIDTRSLGPQEPLSPALIDAIERHLATGGQVLIFRNRRGIAPVLRCRACNWIACCRRCEARYTLHPGHDRQGVGQLICHHCGASRPAPPQCPECESSALDALGSGTVRVEQALQARFPGITITRIDRDNTQRKGSLEALLEKATQGRLPILVGTQMLAKGHHFPGVTLAAIVDADHGLFSADFRATERMAQLITQVAGRAGRAERPGEVLIQTRSPEHPLLTTLLSEGYPAFAQLALEERRAAGWPPFTRLALIRAEAVSDRAAMAFLEWARTLADEYQDGRVAVLGPVPAPMAKRAGRHRAQLLAQSAHSAPLQRLLQQWVPALAEHPMARKVRWSVDVDPLELF